MARTKNMYPNSTPTTPLVFLHSDELIGSWQTMATGRLAPSTRRKTSISKRATKWIPY